MKSHMLYPLSQPSAPEFFILISLSVNGHVWPVAPIGQDHKFCEGKEKLSEIQREVERSMAE